MSSHKFKVTRLERRLGRYELISWINSFLRIDYTKVEEFSDGIAYCQVLDAMIPHSVPLHIIQSAALPSPPAERHTSRVRSPSMHHQPEQPPFAQTHAPH